MKVLKMFESEFQQLKLKKVQLKRDPLNPDKPYVGYFLHENEDGTFKIAIIGGSTMDVSPNEVEPENFLNGLEKFKLAVANYIKDPELAKQIQNMGSVSDIETQLLSSGFTYEDLYCITKCLCSLSDDTETNTIAEGLFDKIGRGWNKFRSTVNKAEAFSKGDYGAFAGPGKVKAAKPTVKKAKEPALIYTGTLLKMGEPFPIDTRNFQISRVHGRKDLLRFTIKIPQYGSVKGFTPDIINMFKNGQAYEGTVITTNKAGQPIRMVKGHYLIDPKSLRKI